MRGVLIRARKKARWILDWAKRKSAPIGTRPQTRATRGLPAAPYRPCSLIRASDTRPGWISATPSTRKGSSIHPHVASVTTTREKRGMVANRGSSTTYSMRERSTVRRLI